MIAQTPITKATRWIDKIVISVPELAPNNIARAQKSTARQINNRNDVNQLNERNHETENLLQKFFGA